MKIEIADRLKPFSHQPGHAFMIPGTNYFLKAFPTALFLSDGEGEEKEIPLSLKGPIDPFTVEQDLESRSLRIYGQSLEGYFRLSVKVWERRLMLFFEKTPLVGIESCEKTFFSGDALELSKEVSFFEESFQEKLFLGSSKQKEADLIRRRKDLREIFPLWHRLGGMTPRKEGSSSPLLEESIDKKDKKQVEALFFHTYLAHFSAGLVPRQEDVERQGLSPVMHFSDNLLFQGFSGIRSLFFQEKEEGVYILPCLLSSFVCGKLIQVQSKSGAIFDIEWTKHRLRKVHIKVEKDQVLRLHFPGDVESFRWKRSRKERGKVFEGKNIEIPVKAGDLLWLDLFQK